LTTYKVLREYLWDECGPVNYSSKSHVKSQDLKTYKALTFTAMIISRALGIERRYYIGKK